MCILLGELFNLGIAYYTHLVNSSIFSAKTRNSLHDLWNFNSVVLKRHSTKFNLSSPCDHLSVDKLTTSYTVRLGAVGTVSKKKNNHWRLAVKISSEKLFPNWCVCEKKIVDLSRSKFREVIQCIRFFVQEFLMRMTRFYEQPSLRDATVTLFGPPITVVDRYGPMTSLQ